VAYLYTTCVTAEASSSVGGGGSAHGGAGGSSWAGNGISESSSGTLFRAIRVRKYAERRQFATWTPSRAGQDPGRKIRPTKSGRLCKNWAVTTTIFPPTATVKQIASLPEWCLVIAGDKKTPAHYNVSGSAVYLSPADQERLPFATGRLLRWNHFGRKNLGFLYALQHGARWVYDTDDDNELQNIRQGIPLPRPNALVDEVDTSHKLYNLYRQMSTVPTAWPRGFPLEAVKDNRTWSAGFTKRTWLARRVGVVQSLADHDPDVDGIYRLTQPLPFTFPPKPRFSAGGGGGRGGGGAGAAEAPSGAGRRLAQKAIAAGRAGAAAKSLVLGAKASGGRKAARSQMSAGGDSGGGGDVGGGGGGDGGGGRMVGGGAVRGMGNFLTISLRKGTMMPYNAQATLHAYDALWGLLLPCTVHGRVTDIWRAYFTQRLLWDVGYRIAFSTPWVTQYRNAHNYLADFNSELPLYQQAGALVDALLTWSPSSPSLPGRIEELYVMMYEMAIIGIDDVRLAQAWLRDLIAVGYRFPPLVRDHR
jgi:hypothetical protein